jgi:hypothetical protein
MLRRLIGQWRKLISLRQALGDLVLIFDQFPHYQAHIGNMCHDEIDVVCDSNYALEVAAIVQNTMRQAMANYITIIPVDEAVSPQSLITVNKHGKNSSPESSVFCLFLRRPYQH